MQFLKFNRNLRLLHGSKIPSRTVGIFQRFGGLYAEHVRITERDIERQINLSEPLLTVRIKY